MCPYKGGGWLSLSHTLTPESTRSPWLCAPLQVFIGQGQQDKTAFPYDCIFYDGSAVKAVTDFDGFDRLCVRKTFEYMCSDIDTVAVD